jgi:type IV secretion system protein VirB2
VQLLRYLTLVGTLSAAAPAFAQIAKLTQTLSFVQAVLIGAAISLFTIALLIAGSMMAFRHAKWTEVSHIVIGGVFVGAAPAIAAVLVG